jgi:nucleoside-diphosphate-sugar epimerase
MPNSAPTVLITGVAGNLGRRLVPLLGACNVIGADLHASNDCPVQSFHQIDLGEESSCAELARLLIEKRIDAVVHLAFVLDPLRTGVLDPERMWRINVAGTARVLEAIAEANRMGGSVGKLVHLSSVSVYGPDLDRPATEAHPLKAHTLNYALHKKEADEVVRARARALGDCRVFLLRPHIFVGQSVQNYMVCALRGTAFGTGKLGQRLERKGRRLPLLLPMGRKYPEHKLQFIHVDDMARLIAFLLRHSRPAEQVTILNVAGRGDSLSVADCARMADSEIKRMPTRLLCRSVIRLMWSLGISSIPPDAFPYMVGSYTMDTTHLRNFLGPNYNQVIQYTNQDAFLDNVAEVLNRSTAGGTGTKESVARQ